MKVSTLYGKGRTVFSLEVFPPKKTSNINTIYNTIEKLKDLKPDFISVTYGAGGNAADNSTCEIASIIKNKYNIESMAHLTCINNTKDEVDAKLKSFKENNIENILALRGDKNPDLKPKTDFLYASDLVSYIKEKGDFNISGACYPEGHIEAEDIVADVLNLKHKVDMGVDELTSQLFFDNNMFYSFMERVKIAKISVPISAGIMPVTSKSQIERMVAMCGASLPQKFVKMIQRYDGNPEALRDAGIAYAVNQIVDLIANGVEGIHLYTMNNPYVATKIYESINTLL